MRRLVRNPERRRDRLLRLGKISRIVHQLPNQLLAIERRAVNQRFGKKTRRLRQPKLYVRPAFVVDPPQERAIFIRSKLLVELLTQGGNHWLEPERIILTFALTLANCLRRKNARERERQTIMPQF